MLRSFFSRASQALTQVRSAVSRVADNVVRSGRLDFIPPIRERREQLEISDRIEDSVGQLQTLARQAKTEYWQRRTEADQKTERAEAARRAREQAEANARARANPWERVTDELKQLRRARDQYAKEWERETERLQSLERERESAAKNLERLQGFRNVQPATLKRAEGRLSDAEGKIIAAQQRLEALTAERREITELLPRLEDAQQQLAEQMRELGREAVEAQTTHQQAAQEADDARQIAGDQQARWSELENQATEATTLWTDALRSGDTDELRQAEAELAEKVNQATEEENTGNARIREEQAELEREMEEEQEREPESDFPGVYDVGEPESDDEGSWRDCEWVGGLPGTASQRKWFTDPEQALNWIYNITGEREKSVADTPGGEAGATEYFWIVEIIPGERYEVWFIPPSELRRSRPAFTQ